MSQPFLSQVTMMGFNFPPRGYALCDGQILPINQHQSLYSLLGTTFGGDGRTTFGLPELRGRVPVHTGPGFNRGAKGGVEDVFLTTEQIPSHKHMVKASATLANTNKESGVVLAQAKASGNPVNFYRALEASTKATLKSGTVAEKGENQSHTNMQPWCAITFCIALQGTFPSRS